MAYRKRSRTSSFAAPVAQSSSVLSRYPFARISLSGREYISVVQSTADGSFSCGGLPITPTNPSVFPWLAPIAQQFSEYMFNSLRFVYEPVANTSVSGSVALRFDPDPTNANPTSWKDVTATGVSVHGAPWARHVLPIPTKHLHSRKTYYVRDVSQVSNPADVIDPLEHYPGRFAIATEGVSGSAGFAVIEVGRIYLEYSITLMKAEPAWGPVNRLTAPSVFLSSATYKSNGAGGAFIIPAGGSANALDYFRSACLFGGYTPVGVLSGNELVPFSPTLLADTTRQMGFPFAWQGLMIVTGNAATNVDCDTPVMSIGLNAAGKVGSFVNRFASPANGGNAVSRTVIFAVNALAGNTITVPVAVNGAIQAFGVRIYFVPFIFGCDT